jgi:hypothetical protein
MENVSTEAAAIIWRDSLDTLGRKRDADFLTELLEGRFLRGYTAGQPNSLVLNIDAPWGTGKTFLLDRWAADLEEAGWLVLRFNAWEHDYAADPLLSFIAQMREQIEKRRQPGAKLKTAARNLSLALGKHLAPAVAKSVAQMGLHLVLGPAASTLANVLTEEALKDAETSVGEAASKVVENAAERMLAEAQAINHNLVSFKSALAKYASTESPKKPVVLLIDELDRCRPTFSIDLLEVLKHVFSVPGVYSVVATDTEQLAHSAKNVYGSDFAAKEYLKRFFDLRYDLGRPDGHPLVFYLLKEHGLLDDEHLLAPTTNTDREADPKRPRCYLPLMPSAAAPSDAQKASRAMFLIAAKDQFQLTNRDARRAVELIRAVVDSFIARTKRQQPPAKLHFPYLALLVAAYVKDEDLLQSDQKLRTELARPAQRSIGAGPWEAHKLSEIVVLYESERRALAQREWRRDRLGPEIHHLREQNPSSDRFLADYRAMVARCGHISSN